MSSHLRRTAKIDPRLYPHIIGFVLKINFPMYNIFYVSLNGSAIIVHLYFPWSIDSNFSSNTFNPLLFQSSMISCSRVLYTESLQIFAIYTAHLISSKSGLNPFFATITFLLFFSSQFTKFHFTSFSLQIS